MANRRHPVRPSVLYEDEWLIAFDKPGGWRLAPETGDRDRPCLLQFARERLAAELLNTHRLDDEISGVALFAKTRAALSAVTGQFQKHSETRRMLALVLHAPPAAELDIAQPIEPNPALPGAMRIGGGKAALVTTRIRILARWRGYSLVEATPGASRPHQVRVHLAHAGCPVLADALYGPGGGLKLSAIKPRYRAKSRPERPLLDRLALHTESLELLHPATRAPLVLRAPLPDDFAVAIKYLQRFRGTGPGPGQPDPFSCNPAPPNTDCMDTRPGRDHS